jgi:hypothetical protein
MGVEDVQERCAVNGTINDVEKLIVKIEEVQRAVDHISKEAVRSGKDGMD